MSNKYNDVVKLVENATSLEELQAARALTSAYRLQTGGFNKDLKYEIDTLYVSIMNKEKELLRL